MTDDRDREARVVEEGAGDGDQGGRRYGASRGGPRREGGYGEGGARRRRRVCQFCTDKVKSIDYKDVNLLRQFTARSGGRIVARRKTGTCAKHQRLLSTAIKRARHLAFLPYTTSHTRGFRP